MGYNLTHKILSRHLVSGTLQPGAEIAIKIDQTLTQDATGTLAYLQFEALDIPRVRTRISVSYVDHNMLQTGFEAADDHRYLQTAASRYGINFSRPGNGICHQVHLERYAVPGETLLGSDSHTPTAGGLGMIAIGVGGLDVAAAMGGFPFYLSMPQVVLVRLTGKLGPWVASKDIILELLRRLTVKGGVGKVFEYGGEGVAHLTVPERATITNMGAELGATTSVFPSDLNSLAFLKAQGRQTDWRGLTADPDAGYDDELEIDLSGIDPLIARPHSPDNVCKVSDLEGTRVDQVCIGSCTNSSFRDLMTVAEVLKDKSVHPDVSLAIAPGSRQVLQMLAQNGALAAMVHAGARVLESACGPCIGMGQAPSSGGISIRTVNRNFEGRSGTADAWVYLASVETAVAAAVHGTIVDPRRLGAPVSIEAPEQYAIDDNMIIPAAVAPEVEIIRGPNIKPLPPQVPLANTLRGKILLRTGDNVTTDHILPAGANILPLRSNIPAISEHAFERLDSSFAARAMQEEGGFVVGGENYGQGSSREHAALAPRYLGVRAVIVKSFARIHRANLVNFGILPLTFADPKDYDLVAQGDELELDVSALDQAIPAEFSVRNLTSGTTFAVSFQKKDRFSPREAAIVRAGGLLSYIRQQR